MKTQKRSMKCVGSSRSAFTTWNAWKHLLVHFSPPCTLITRQVGLREEAAALKHAKGKTKWRSSSPSRPWSSSSTKLTSKNTSSQLSKQKSGAKPRWKSWPHLPHISLQLLFCCDINRDNEILMAQDSSSQKI